MWRTTKKTEVRKLQEDMAALAAAQKGDRVPGTRNDKTVNQALRVDVALTDKTGEELWRDPSCIFY